MLPNSLLELKAVQQDLRWSGNIFNVAKYGVDPKIFLDADPNKFREYTGIRGDFVLQAGRIEAGKNQAMLCWAMRTQIYLLSLLEERKNGQLMLNYAKQ